jgi:hypothetical protein
MRASSYNELLSLGDADERFAGRTDVFARLVPLLAKYEYRFGVCLVHTHCKLDEGEIMLADGNISEPVYATPNDEGVFPDRWLASGEAYEFTKAVTPSPPAALVQDFKVTVGDYADVLGLWYAGDAAPNVFRIEYTEGRKNITKVRGLDHDLSKESSMETGWLPGIEGGNPVMMRCWMLCDWLTTRGKQYHRNTQRHHHIPNSG